MRTERPGTADGADDGIATGSGATAVRAGTTDAGPSAVAGPRRVIRADQRRSRHSTVTAPAIGARARLPLGPRARRRVAVLAGIALLLVTSLVLVGAVVAKSARDAADAGRISKGYVAPGSLPGIDVVGDVATFTAGLDAGVEWPALTAAALKAQTTLLVDPRAGFTKGSHDTTTVTTLAMGVDPDASVVVLAGGANDTRAGELALVSAATQAISAVRGRSPNAAVVVVAPVGASSPAERTVRRALKTAASLDDATWLDPRAWLKSRPGLLKGTGTVTEAGQRELARHFRTALRPLLG